MGAVAYGYDVGPAVPMGDFRAAEFAGPLWESEELANRSRACARAACWLLAT